MLAVNIKRICKPDPSLIKKLYEEAGMKLEVINRKFFADENNILLAAYLEDVPAGFLYAYILERIDSHKPIILLYSIDVFPGYQKMGIGGSLIQDLKRRAISKKCSEIFVLTTENNIAAKSLYKKTGGIRENEDDVMFVFSLEANKN